MVQQDSGYGSALAELVEELLLVDSEQSSVLATLHDRVRKIADASRDPETENIITAAAQLLKNARDGVVDNGSRLIEAATEALAAVLSLHREELTLADLDLPIELGLPTTGMGAVRTHTSSVDQQILAEFLENQGSVLDEAEALALALERPEQVVASVAALKRIIHTLKGESGLLGMSDISDLCHKLEDQLAATSDESAASITPTLLEAIDQLRRWIGACKDGAAGSPPTQGCGTSESPGRAVDGTLTEDPAPEDPAPENPVVSDTSDTAPIEFDSRPIELGADTEILGDFILESAEHLDSAEVNLLLLESTPEDSEALNAVFRTFHTIKGVAGFLDLAPIQQIAHESESLLDAARQGQLRLAGPVFDAVLAAVDTLKALLASVQQSIHLGQPLHPDPALAGLLHRLRTLGKRHYPDADPEPAVASTPTQGQSTSSASSASSTTAPSALVADQAQPPSPALAPQASRTTPAKTAVQVRETIKVDAGRLDALVEIIGEMVIAEAMVSQSDEFQRNKSEGRLPALLNHLDKITRELHEMAMSLRMVTVRSTFNRMARLARDVATKTGKKIHFVTSGENTELDKTVVDSIGDPLVHMVRNAVDHGIEADIADRRNAGKPEAGRIELRAFHRGGSIYVEIEDDGQGLDRSKILAKAIERGVVREGETMSDNDIHNLIFEPGFSTAAAITDVSGRGVGLDVVKRNIEALRGSTEIRSRKGRGTVFSMRLPLTLAIIDGMVVRVGTQRYVVPTLAIVRMIRPHEQDLSTILKRGTMLKIGGEMIPVYRLGVLFEVADAVQDISRAAVVVVEHDNNKSAFVVDELLGQQQIVIKGLGESLEGTPGLAGGAIMPDGRVGLILDIPSLVDMSSVDMGPYITTCARHTNIFLAYGDAT